MAVAAVGPAHDLEGLGADADVEEGRALLGEDVGVGLDQAAHHHLALPEGRLDDDVTGVAGGRIGGEHHPRPLRGDHDLDHHAQGRHVGDRPAGPVGDDPGAVEGGPAAHDGAEQLAVPGDVGEGGVHAGERGVGPVLGGPRRPHRHPDAVAEAVVGLQHRGGQVRRQGDGADQLLGGGGGPLEIVGVVGAGADHQRPELLVDAGRRQRVAVGLGGDHEPGGHRQPGRRQLTQVGALAPDQGGVGHPDPVEPADQLHGPGGARG